MLTENVTALNETGVHMRPAQILVTKLAPLDATVTVKHDGKSVNAKSIMMLMAACIKKGHDLEVVCEGPDEAKAMGLMEDFFKGVMDEE
ncbi:MAG: HPr family phosphocarrier protein [Deltaproteobacteria bacterium]|nr:HPr family phosphocarrier protein [Deltaproteobacteria bacterium]